jgi:hypothetical protein
LVIRDDISKLRKQNQAITRKNTGGEVDDRELVGLEHKWTWKATVEKKTGPRNWCKREMLTLPELTFPGNIHSAKLHTTSSCWHMLRVFTSSHWMIKH